MKKVKFYLQEKSIYTICYKYTFRDSTFCKWQFGFRLWEKRVSQNPNVKVKDIKINTKKELALAGWTGYILDIDAVVQGKEIKAKDFLFTNGTHIAPELIDMKTMQSLKDSLFPNLTEKYYNKSNFIAGNEKAKIKLYYSRTHFVHFVWITYQQL